MEPFQSRSHKPWFLHVFTLQDSDFLFSWQVTVALGEALQATEVKMLRKVRNRNRNLIVSAKLKFNSQLISKRGR